MDAEGANAREASSGGAGDVVGVRSARVPGGRGAEAGERRGGHVVIATPSAAPWLDVPIGQQTAPALAGGRQVMGHGTASAAGARTEAATGRPAGATSRKAARTQNERRTET